MAKLVVIQSNGLMMFAHHFEPKWKFWKKRLQLTTQRQNAMEISFTSPDDFSDPYSIAKKCYPKADKISYLEGMELMDCTDITNMKYWVILKGKSRHSLLARLVIAFVNMFLPTRRKLNADEWYDFDKEFYSSKLHRRISKPHFCKDINKAEFIKSRQYADEVATRCRQENNKLVAVREVYVYRENELLRRNIVVVLRHKVNKKMKPQFIRTYNMGNGEFTKTSNFTQAARYTYEDFLELYDNCHALHKEYMVLPKILNNDIPIKASDVTGKEMVGGTMRLRNNK